MIRDILVSKANTFLSPRDFALPFVLDLRPDWLELLLLGVVPISKLTVLYFV